MPCLPGDPSGPGGPCRPCVITTEHTLIYSTCIMVEAFTKDTSQIGTLTYHLSNKDTSLMMDSTKKPQVLHVSSEQGRTQHRALIARAPPLDIARTCARNIECITTLPSLRTTPPIATRTPPLSILGTPLVALYKQ